MRRRSATVVAVVVLVLSAVAVVVLTSRDSKKGPSTSPSTSAANETARGRPCVAVSPDALPAGAPAVPVKQGPPPERLVTEDLKLGTGAPVAADATVTVNYVGVTCSTGEIFDSSYSRNQPATFPLNGVIRGWQEGIPGMKVGGQRLLGIPSEQAYGSEGRPPTIGPDEALWFVVEVLDTKPA